MSDSDLGNMDAGQLCRLFASGKASPQEAAERTSAQAVTHQAVTH